MVLIPGLKSRAESDSRTSFSATTRAFSSGGALAVGVVAVSLWFFGKALIAAAQANQDARESHTLLNQRAKELEAANSLIAQRTQSFHNIVERSSDGILVVDTDGRICFANRAAEGFFGLTHQELIGSISTFSMSDEGVVEMDFYLEYGEKGVAELLIGESEWEGKPAYLAVIRDVTKRNHAEEMLSAAFSYSPVAMSIGLFDSGTYIAVNDVFEKLTGFTSTEVVGRSSRELNLYKNEQDRECIFGLLRDQGYVHNYEFTLRRKNDELRFANVSVELIELEGQRCYLASTIDITERKQAMLNTEKINCLDLKFLSPVPMFLKMY